ncbi:MULTISPECIES: hypothetical protein [unclassified Aurantimonas]|uniref:hypothetical protein n=1 Tax=unclassified Aurantimonas TaxID=2638230 RepID=UPI002E19C1D6|nr:MULTISPECIES: hypothetical protein [unclassified Aurantimonas]MEC5289390.1 hypothetical protein [Aurantimonas sp. C2-3-R2]MEC5410470.1 hypothetical protein [Aurantimonas sp. C2-4-R8]
MTAVNITNHHDSALTVGKVTITPGRTAAVPRWETVKRGQPVATWLKLGVIAEAGDTPKPQAPEVVNDPDVLPVNKPIEDMTKAELVDYGKANGLTIDASDTKSDIFDQIVDAEG